MTHDMFSERFSFPSWCFSLVMGKWFKGKCPRQGRGWHDRRGVGSCLGKTQQKAADCLKLLREAQTTSNIARLNILSSTEIFPWLGWNPFQSCACDMRGGELSMPRHLSSSGRARLNCWSSVTFPLPRNVWRTIAVEQQWHQTWENPAHLSQLEFCQKQLLCIKIGKKWDVNVATAVWHASEW